MKGDLGTSDCGEYSLMARREFEGPSVEALIFSFLAPNSQCTGIGTENARLPSPSDPLIFVIFHWDGEIRLLRR